MYIKGYNPAFEVVCVAQRMNKKKKWLKQRYPLPLIELPLL